MQRIACPEEIDWRNGWINDGELEAAAAALGSKEQLWSVAERAAQAADVDPW